jgi:Tfp pilus assembly protein PilN
VRAVNLLPTDGERVRSDTGRAPLIALVGAVVATTLAFGFLHMSASSGVSSARSDLASTRAALALTTTQHESVSVPAVAQQRADRVAALSAALSSRVPMDRLLRDLAFVLPADVWLTGLAVSTPDSKTPTPPASAGPGTASAPEVTIQGITYSQAGVARLLARLSIVPSLEDVRLDTSTRVVQASVPGAEQPKKKRKPLVSFTIAASFVRGS